MKTSIKLLLVVIGCAFLTACGSSKRNIAMNVQSDPLGAYLLMQIKYRGDENPEWIFLGPTPVVMEKEIKYEGATTVSLKVIRPGFFEQTKTWKAKEFAREYKKNRTIAWIPNMVKQ